ncbi:mannitol dehydrogenase family protein [Methylobacterium nonmethylotrophicum]|uniref:Mannitol dehydrogenase family protein n=1 Tax=Methylobacterium nonmethylotrophicum TaxID=1141884 RepID=A0A4Z0NH74_9HYPH|nr:mannitol dehydrogenase family protein [Methylobacterium nonmethylotrophicum]TGD95453.1 mannitol dehydrogenase family protein [Methylobacterium nonmethylotrophicum]
MSADPQRDPVPLRRATLASLAPGMRRPAYDVTRVRAGIVHLGLGGFHRAHMARYTHDLMARDPDALAWGILGVGLMPGDRRMIDALAPQDALYTLVEREGADETVTVIGSLAGVAFAGETTAALLDAIDDPAIRVVSLTVTENGYCLDPATKRLNPDHPLIRADLAEPERPKSAVGVIVEALRRRRAAGAAPFTPLTCDNIQHNGDVLRDAVVSLARLRDAVQDSGLADWIAAAVAFPSTMVDRITPVTAAADVEALSRRHGLSDAWPVFSETFTQWVIEDRFPAGRPAWERVGAQFVADVAPYEFMKLRLLNGSHLAVSGLGRLAGYVTIDEAMADPRIAAVMTALMDRETGPTVPPVPGIDLEDYKRTLVARFANPAIRDTVERVNTDAPLNVLVDPIRGRLQQGGSVEFLALALAAWLRRVRGEDESGGAIEVRHPMAALLRERAVQGGPDPRPLLGLRPLFGELGDDPRLVEPVAHWLGMLYGRGIQATLDEAARRAAL